MFDIQEFLKSEQNTHQFTTDNAYLNQLGLGTFTTGTLYAYFNARNKLGFYANRGVITEGDGGAILNIGEFLGTEYKDNDGWGAWEGWRKSEYTGNYVAQKYNNWELIEGNMVQAYTFDQLSFDDFAFNQTQITDTVQGNPSQAVFNEDHFDIKNVQLKVQKDSQDDIQKAIQDHTFLNNSPLINIINMNDFMISVKRKKARAGDNGWATLNGGKFGKGELFAMDEYLTDIKSSKGKYLTCSGLLTFNIAMADERFQCPKTEWVTYRLSLFDAPPQQSPRAKAVLRSVEMAQIKRDATGRKYLSKTDGDATSADENNPGHKTTAEMKLSYNPYLNKWESGTQSVLAKITTDISKAFFNPTVATLKDSDIEADLANPAETSHFAPTSGLAMPITMQNSNPFQYAPGYALDANCRAEDKTKQVLPVFNFNPKKSFKVDDTVMLSQIDGIWHCVDLGEDLEEDTVVETSFAGQWQFQYFATNNEYFFKMANSNSLVQPSLVERSFHKAYYANDPKNGGTFSGDVSKEAGVDYPDFISRGLNLVLSDDGPNDLSDGYFQISSFDFMDNDIFGRRDKNALATTLGTTDTAGRNLVGDDDDLYNNGAHSIYFGCAFPDGYDIDSVNTMASGQKTFNVTYHNSGAKLPNQNNSYFNDSEPMGNLGSLVFGGVGPNIDNRQIYPFLEDQRIETDDQNKIIAYDPVRNDYRNATNVFPDEDFIQENGRREWTRDSLKHQPSMFYEYNNGSSRSLKHLPADIALNASIGDTYGNPFFNVHRCSKFHKKDFYGSDLRLEVKRAFNDATWLVQTPEVAIQSSGDYSANSAFGFEPSKAGRIQFRPLKMDLYAAYNTKISGEMARRNVIGGNISASDMRPNSSEAEALWSSLTWSQMLSTEAPYAGGDSAGTVGASEQQRQRNLSRTDALNPLYRFPTDPSKEGFSTLSFNYHNKSNNTSSRRHFRDYWSDTFQWQDRETESIGAGCFGVIGATTTVTVNQEISFNTDQFFGMESVTLIRITGLNTTSLFDTKRYHSQLPSWGGSDKNFQSFNTTNLSVTVYHAHPREQTIYDPRFFCVHHFNELPAYEGYNTGGNLLARYGEFDNGQSWPASGASTVQTNAGDTLTYFFHEDITESQIGIREPSVFNQENDFPLPLDAGSAVFKNGYKVDDEYRRLLPQENWHLNVTRVGKLLPYGYKYYSLTSPFASGDVVSSNEMLNIGADGQDFGVAEDNVGKIAYTNLGQDLQAGDVVGNSAFGVFFSVDEARHDGDGNVIFLQLQAFDTGENITSSSFAQSDDQIATGYNGGLPLVMVAGTGKNFRGALLSGEVTAKTGLDLKPKAVAREQELSLPADNTGRIDVIDGIAPPFGFVRGERDETLFIESEDRSADSRYDCFFHFHNDCSMTWLGGEHFYFADAINAYAVNEQYVTLNIGGT